MNMTVKTQKPDIFLSRYFRFFDLLVSKLVFHIQDRRRLHHLSGTFFMP